MPSPEQTPAWECDFSKLPDGPVNPDDWNTALGNRNGWGNRQQQTYTADSRNLRIENGLLILEGHREHDAGQPRYTSARIDTMHKRSFGYGTLEVTAKLPKGTGAWPAIWMLSDTAKYQPDKLGVAGKPAAWVLNGEIDIMEAVGSRPSTVYPAIHTYYGVTNNVSPEPRPQQHAPSSSGAFHTYGVTRTPNDITFAYDGAPYYQISKEAVVPAGTSEADIPLHWPFDQNYYLIINLALGGTWGGEQSDTYPPYGIDDSTAPWQYAVQAVKYYPDAK
jgi:beta-glucanase (GH16 family)